MIEKSVNIGEVGWQTVLSHLFNEDYFKSVTEQVRDLYLNPKKEVYPKPKDLFNAFKSCPYDKVAVVILGQDPYHGQGQAHGMSFSVCDGVSIPPSLQNIFKEIESDLGVVVYDSGDLTRWAVQGVFLLNAILTVEKNSPASHKGIGWEKFTDAVIQLLSSEKEKLVFLLWGNYAKQKAQYIDSDKHLVLTAPHPSPFSANSGFFGCKHFSKANTYLQKHGKQPINWK